MNNSTAGKGVLREGLHRSVNSVSHRPVAECETLHCLQPILLGSHSASTQLIEGAVKTGARSQKCMTTTQEQVVALAY